MVSVYYKGYNQGTAKRKGCTGRGRGRVLERQSFHARPLWARVRPALSQSPWAELSCPGFLPCFMSMPHAMKLKLLPTCAPPGNRTPNLGILLPLLPFCAGCSPPGLVHFRTPACWCHRNAAVSKASGAKSPMRTACTLECEFPRNSCSP